MVYRTASLVVLAFPWTNRRRWSSSRSEGPAIWVSFSTMVSVLCGEMNRAACTASMMSFSSASSNPLSPMKYWF